MDISYLNTFLLFFVFIKPLSYYVLAIMSSLARYVPYYIDNVNNPETI